MLLRKIIFFYIHKEDYKPFSYLKANAVFPEYGENDQAFDYFKDNKLRQFQGNVRVIGPSGFIMINDYAIALSTQVRVVASANRVPQDIATFAYQGLKFKDQHDINYNDFDFKMGALSWAEVNLSYAKTIHHHGFNQWNIGGTIKYLMGYSGGYLDGNNLNYLIFDDSTANVLNLNATAAVALPLDPTNNDYPYGATFKGKGVGFDFGVTFVRTRKGYQNQKV